MTNIQTNIGDLKRQLEDLQSITNANIARTQKLLETVSSSRFGELPYKDQYNYLQCLHDTVDALKDHFRDISSKAGEQVWNIHYKTRFSIREKAKLSRLADIEYARVNKTPAKNIPFAVFKAMIAEEGIPLDDRNKLIRERGDKRFKEIV